LTDQQEELRSEYRNSWLLPCVFTQAEYSKRLKAQQLRKPVQQIDGVPIVLGRNENIADDTNAFRVWCRLKGIPIEEMEQCFSEAVIKQERSYRYAFAQLKGSFKLRKAMSELKARKPALNERGYGSAVDDPPQPSSSKKKKRKVQKTRYEPAAVSQTQTQDQDSRSAKTRLAPKYSLDENTLAISRGSGVSHAAVSASAETQHENVSALDYQSGQEEVVPSSSDPSAKPWEPEISSLKSQVQYCTGAGVGINSGS